MKVTTWLADSLHRQFPLSPPGRRRSIAIAAARGERVAFQACVRVGGTTPVEVSAEVDTRAALPVQVRRVGCVPVPHHNAGTPPDELDGWGMIPGYVPDPLFPDTTVKAAACEVTAFWVSVDVPRDAAPGAKHVRVTLSVDGRRTPCMTATVLVSPVVLAKRRRLRVGHWFYADSLCDRYGVEPFDRAFWRVCETYMRNYTAHGCDTIYVPAFTPPLDGVKRPTQLLRVRRTGPRRYAFGWRDVKRWIDLARRCGVTHFQWTHLFTQWGCRHAIRIYEKQDGQDRLLWRPGTSATSRTYREFLSQYLPALERFLQRERLTDVSLFSASDEPHGDQHLANYRKARTMLRELAPWMRIMDAISDIRFAKEGLVDVPVPMISVAKQFVDAGIPSWTYFCCAPKGRYLNRFLDTPLAKARMAGWLLYRFQVLGFLQWGYNYWYKSQTRQMIDPYTVTDGLAWPGWAYGDTFLVYPGPDGPVDSIRWEMFAESLQDYALLETLGVDPADRRLAVLKDFDDFPKDGTWLTRMRRKLLGVS